MKEIIQSKIKLPEDVYQIFLASARKKEAPKNRMLFQPDNVSRKCLFITDGILRGYKIIDGKDHTHHFFTPNWFATDYQSFLSDSPGSLYIESLTEIKYFEFDREVLYNLYETYHELEKLGRIIAENAYLVTVKKFSEIQTLDLKARYKNLVKNDPQLFQNVPQKYIASYLGVSEQSLSRIKKELIS